MNSKELINDYAIITKIFLDVSISKFFSIKPDRKDYNERAFFTLIEEPVYSIIKHYTKDSYDWKKIHDEAEVLSNYYIHERKSKSFEFMKKRGYPVEGLEEKIAKLKGLSEEEFYVTYFKIPEVPEIFNKLFDNVSFMILGKSVKAEFIF